ncbi:MAG: VWA domain-containing protein [Cyanobacteria bacterium SZAS-4]|nr:VWA domain-containing protein [Cyanobacteria bacterium SZAS-4]
MFDHLLRNPITSEQDYRLSILNALLRTPHRDVAPYIPLFQHVHENDPLFFGHLAAWYFDNGSVHDLKQLFVAFMATSKFSDEYRDSGLRMLEKMPPYQVERVVRVVKGHRNGKDYVPGIVASVPRSLRSAVKDYLDERERDQKAFDSAALHARKSLKTLYASLRIKPGDYAQKVLFDEKPPEESRLFTLKKIAACSDASEQARLIVENRIPYKIASSVVKNMTPAALVAIVSVMTPQEVINNLASLKKRGAMGNVDLRKLIESKLESAKSDKRVSALKTRQAIKAADLDDEMVSKVEAVGDQQIKAKGRIKKSTALLVDKSGSMDEAIEVGKQVASLVAPICEADLYVYAFDSMGYEIKAKGAELSDWEKAFQGIKAGGNTSCGIAVEMLRRSNRKVEQIVMITDQGDNAHPLFPAAMKSYAESMNIMPSVIIVNVGTHSDTVERGLKGMDVEVDTFTFKGDYYSLPNLIPLLCSGTRMELLMDIMNYELPHRQEKKLVTV